MWNQTTANEIEKLTCNTNVRIAKRYGCNGEYKAEKFHLIKHSTHGFIIIQYINI